MKDEIPWESWCRDYDIKFNGVVAATSEVRSALQLFVNPIRTKVIWGWIDLINCPCLTWIWCPRFSHLGSFLIHSLTDESVVLQVAFLFHWLHSKQAEMRFAIFRQLTLEKMNHTSLVWCLLPVTSPVRVEALHPLTYSCNLSGFYEFPAGIPPCWPRCKTQVSEWCTMLPTLDQIQMHAYRTRAILHTQSSLSEHMPVKILFMIYYIFRKSHSSL